jgi:predicted N-acyltransferase
MNDAGPFSMNNQNHTSLTVQIAHSIEEIGQISWDELSADRPFQSYRWYLYGEHVMEDSPPVYIILSQGSRTVARAACWLVRNEPLPVGPRAQGLVRKAVRRWPLLICRSPLSGTAGLILPDPPRREAALQTLARTARQELRRLGGSFLIFDYLDSLEVKQPGWPKGFSPMTIPDPGTRMELSWKDFDAFLASNKWRMRQHFKRTQQQASDLGIQISRHKQVRDIEAALTLIDNVEKRHKSAPDPWARNMLKKMDMTDSTWLEARIDNRLVGCLLLLVDEGVQIAKLPGLTEDVPFAYFMLLYEAIQVAFENKVQALRWGSGAYETKRRLGFELENNNEIVIWGRGLIPSVLASLFQ